MPKRELRQAGLLGLAGASDARNRLQVGSDGDIVPIIEKMLCRVGDGGADFEDQPAAGLERGARLRNQAGDDLGAGGSGEDGVARLEFADFELDMVFFGLADVGRIRDDEIECVEV